MPIYGNMVGGGAPLKTLILQDEDGNEITGVVVGQETIFTATDNDVRENMVYAGDAGVSTGTKVIPSYHSREGHRVITNGSDFILPNVDYDYTKLQAIICLWNTTLQDSTYADKVVINDNVYNTQSTVVIAEVMKDDNNAWVDFGITNTSGSPCLIRYFMYKEIY